MTKSYVYQYKSIEICEVSEPLAALGHDMMPKYLFIYIFLG